MVLVDYIGIFLQVASILAPHCIFDKNEKKICKFIHFNEPVSITVPLTVMLNLYIN